MMSSMDKFPLKNFAILALPFAVAPVPVMAEDQALSSVASWSAADWDEARAGLVAQQSGQMAGAISRWEQLSGGGNHAFDDYAGFLLLYPDFPQTQALRAKAEAQLSKEIVPADRLVAYFDRFAPLTNDAQARYSLALMSQNPQAALEVARTAWRGGVMDANAERSIQSIYGRYFTQIDHDARMDALLWSRDRAAAERQLPLVSPEKRGLFVARLAILQGGDGATSDPSARTDPGYLWNRSRELRLEGRPQQAVELLANRPPLAFQPHDETAWVTELLNVARIAPARQAVRIAASVDDAFAEGDDISAKPYRLRDDYTSLVWLGGTKALWELGDAAAAAPLFYRYGAAAQTPPTRSKGFYWAGYASERAGDQDSANRYYEMAAAYPERFYGMLALEELGRPLPSFAQTQMPTPTDQERQAFMARPLTQAVAEVARDAPWRTGIRFYRAIAEQAETAAEHMLVADLARQIGRRDLAVILSEAAAGDGLREFTRIGHPTLVTPPGTDWTMVHAITRQESQFAENAISHAGATGLMQLMPATAREQAGKSGVQYMSASLTRDPAYNIRLGNDYFQRMLSYYDGSYPLAIAAYNGGMGNVNKWLRSNGDPRTGSVRWVDWIERIPFYETKNYVQRVLENAAVYEAMYPQYATYGRSRKVSDFLR